MGGGGSSVDTGAIEDARKREAEDAEAAAKEEAFIEAKNKTKRQAGRASLILSDSTKSTLG